MRVKARRSANSTATSRSMPWPGLIRTWPSAGPADAGSSGTTARSWVGRTWQASRIAGRRADPRQHARLAGGRRRQMLDALRRPGCGRSSSARARRTPRRAGCRLPGSPRARWCPGRSRPWCRPDSAPARGRARAPPAHGPRASRTSRAAPRRSRSAPGARPRRPRPRSADPASCRPGPSPAATPGRPRRAPAAPGRRWRSRSAPASAAAPRPPAAAACAARYQGLRRSQKCRPMQPCSHTMMSSRLCRRGAVRPQHGEHVGVAVVDAVELVQPARADDVHHQEERDQSGRARSGRPPRPAFSGCDDDRACGPRARRGSAGRRRAAALPGQLRQTAPNSPRPRSIAWSEWMPSAWLTRCEAT